MLPRTTGLLGLALFATAIMLFATTAVPRADRAHAGIDLTGQWELSFTGGFSGRCDVAIYQNAAEVQMFANCTTIGSSELTGMIDPTTGSFTVSGSFDAPVVGTTKVTLTGTAAADANTIQGTWNAAGLQGTFSATRTSLTPSPPVTAGPSPTGGTSGLPGLPVTGTSSSGGSEGGLAAAALLAAGAVLIAAGWRLRRPVRG